MKFSLKSMVIGVFAILAPTTSAISQTTTYTFEKGHVIDFLLLNQKPNTSEAFREYAQAAISTSRALGYKGAGSFSTRRKPPQSNYHPDVLIFGSWPGTFEDREQSLKELLEAVPTLYEKRLDIWSTFYMSNYEITEDISFEVDHSKIQVLTSYWKNDIGGFLRLEEDFLALVDQFGGVVKLSLSNARSPFGYDYTPEFTTITEWENQEAFDAFLAQNRKMDMSAVKQVQQFYLKPPKPRS